MTYLIPGEPFALSKNKSSRSSLWEQCKRRKMHCTIDLEGQHNDAPLLKGPISIELIFHLKPKRAQKNAKYHILKPDLTALIYFIGEIAQGTIYSNECTIVNLSAKKIYDGNPRTEISIEEIN